MSERADFVKKIEAELDKSVGDRNQDKLAFWRSELDKIPVSVGKSHPLISFILLRFDFVSFMVMLVNPVLSSFFRPSFCLCLCKVISILFHVFVSLLSRCALDI